MANPFKLDWALPLPISLKTAIHIAHDPVIEGHLDRRGIEVNT